MKTRILNTNGPLTGFFQVSAALCYSVLLVANAQPSINVLKGFGFPTLSSGARPNASILEGSDGWLYGTASTGGSGGVGTVFKIQNDGSHYLVLHHFTGTNGDGSTPQGTLVQAADGFFYGTTAYGGASSVGSVFKVSHDGTAYSVLHSFEWTEGFMPQVGLILGSDGLLYGSTSYGADGFGAIFRLNTNGSNFSVLYKFGSGPDGNYPGGLVQLKDGFLYGMTQNGGAWGFGSVFKLKTDGSSYRAIFSFDSLSGISYFPPSLIQGTNGSLYGITPQGGKTGNGRLFKLETDGSGYTILWDFENPYTDGGTPSGGLALGTDGMLYTTTSSGGTNYGGTIFRIAQDGTAASALYHFSGGLSGDAYGFQSSLAQSRTNGAFYGTSAYGGVFGEGTIFRLAPDTGDYSIVFSFNLTGGDGEYPAAGLIQGPDGTLFGTTSQGGSNGAGVVFKLSPNGTGYNVLHSFSPTLDGLNPIIRLTLASNSVLYGMTARGGTNGGGTIFKLNPDGTEFVVLHSFGEGPGDGNLPQANLIVGSDGSLYGTTYYGGGEYNGTVFRLNLDGSGYSILHHFSLENGDGGGPVSLLEGNDGFLYGTTSPQRSFFGLDFSTLFRLSKSGAYFSVLYYFTEFQYAPTPARGVLIQGSDSRLYGVTSSQYEIFNSHGTVFAVTTNGDYSTLYTFNGYPDGDDPQSLLQGSDGMLYGTTGSGGSRGAGTIFKLNVDGTGYTILNNFGDYGQNAIEPQAGLCQGLDGLFYGTTGRGGGMNLGTVFKAVPSSLSIRGIELSSDGALLTVGGAIAGVWYSIEATTDFNAPGNWQEIGLEVADSSGGFEFMDSGASDHDDRFYRLTPQ